MAAAGVAFLWPCNRTRPWLLPVGAAGHLALVIAALFQPADAAPISGLENWLLLENGVFIFGLLLLEAVPFLVEVGVLLDLFTAVFVMGITIFHINREFDHIDSVRLSSLKDLP